MSKDWILDSKTDDIAEWILRNDECFQNWNEILNRPTFSRIQAICIQLQVTLNYNYTWVLKFLIQFLQIFSDFCILDPMDQQKLLARNTHTFIQLYMGQFLLVEPRHIPTSPGDPHPKKAWTNNFQQRLYLERFNAVTELFIPGANLDEYGVCISKLKSLPELSNFRQKAVVAYTILFDCDDKTVCSTNLNLNFIFDYYVRTCENCISFSSLTENLREMATFSTNNIEW